MDSFNMYFKCCLRNCGSTRSDAVLHKFPTDEKRLNKWLQCLKDDSLQKSLLRNLFVCQKHFEKRFINPTTLKLRSHYAYPTLFTQDEISGGTPIKHIDPKESFLSHNYCRKKNHEDHSYSKSKRDDKEENNAIDKLKSTSHSINNKENLIETLDEVATLGKDETSQNDLDEAIESVGIDEVLSDEDVRSVQDLTLDETIEEVPDPSMTHDKDLHNGYKCNVCKSDIRGFRYVCVQCSDWDMCGGCEASGAHARHYVLRLPSPPDTQEHVESVIDRIRRTLCDLDVFIDSIVKDEKEPVCEEQIDPLFGVVETSSVPNAEPLTEIEQYPVLAEDVSTTDINNIELNNSMIFDSSNLVTEQRLILLGTENIPGDLVINRLVVPQRENYAVYGTKLVSEISEDVLRPVINFNPKVCLEKLVFDQPNFETNTNVGSLIDNKPPRRPKRSAALHNMSAMKKGNFSNI